MQRHNINVNCSATSGVRARERVDSEYSLKNNNLLYTHVRRLCVNKY